MKARESDVQAAIMELLAIYGVFALRLNTGTFKVGRRYIRAHSGGRGVADILAFPVRAGHPLPLWIECKSDSGKQTQEQADFEKYVAERGHRYLVARSADEVMHALSELKG